MDTGTTPQAHPPITIRLPSKYATGETSASSPSAAAAAAPSSTATPFTPPPLSFMQRTWTVTHSTLSMWRGSRNVRITYGALPPRDGRERLSDTVEHETVPWWGGGGSNNNKGAVLRRISGTDTASSRGGGETGAWDWRGRGWLALVGGSRWEVLGWGQRECPGEPGRPVRWMVTWFAPTLFTAEGLDLYSDRADGGNEELARDVLAELARVCRGKERLRKLVEQDMREVAISLPWKEA
ncbi:uncharacterized protein P884DRAFT_206678 [Thermothelomyces heterothallicus CBS 202.75]|uniref:uncharacterized protein n=1 Tax=Thermothelomyces heterothallicus CBS 202.75 TaxID=1149848 RepID=UPI003743C353